MDADVRYVNTPSLDPAVKNVEDGILTAETARKSILAFVTQLKKASKLEEVEQLGNLTAILNKSRAAETIAADLAILLPPDKKHDLEFTADDLNLPSAFVESVQS